ncbi:MAG: Tol-Pal system beta propeller repeat protein TolB [Azoarcus sp.]|jgi:TolB protein|nr:Tol-Pal system beta propeller repeat protein TolB [Azoarcus sp.]
MYKIISSRFANAFTGLFRLFLATIFLSVLTPVAQAQIEFTVTGAGDNRFPVIIPVFENESRLPNPVSDIVRADLTRSGLFNVMDLGPMTVPESRTPDLAAMAARGADAVLAASVAPLSDGRFEIRFRLFDTHKQSNPDLGGMIMRTAPAQHRLTAHRIADYIYEKLTGIPGYFSTRIAYVVKAGKNYKLQIADADGESAQTALHSPESIISPAWSPDGSRIAYVSFEEQKPIVYVHTLATGQRKVLANFKGSNSAPAWAPDGRRLAVVLTKEGLSQIYTINADGSGAHRLVNSSGIDTEPAWSPDGQWVYFTSDRSGGPQIYRVSASGGSAERITFEGDYNVTPRPSADGTKLAYLTRSSGRYRVAVLDLASRQVSVLTDSTHDESPSFAPNSNMILYATVVGGRGVLSAVSADGRVKQRITAPAADVREPAWGPLLK